MLHVGAGSVRRPSVERARKPICHNYNLGGGLASPVSVRTHTHARAYAHTRTRTQGNVYDLDGAPRHDSHALHMGHEIGAPVLGCVMG